MTFAETAPLLIGYGREGTFAHLVSIAKKVSPNSIVLDLNQIETCSNCKFEITNQGFKIEIDNFSLEAQASTPIFYRGFFRPSNSEARSNLLRDFIAELEVSLELMPEDSLIFNRPSAGASNSSKALHIRILEQCGFNIPETILSNSGALVEKKIPPNFTWVTKGCSGVRTISSSVGPMESTRFPLLERCPSLFQRRIVGFDVRAHFIQEDYVALKIESSRLDYRYSKRQGGTIDLAVMELPPLIKYQAIEFMQRENLSFAGLDFKVDDRGKWWILEANPMPGFEFFDEYANGAIGNLLLKHLNRGVLIRSGKPKISNSGVFIAAERIPKVDRGL